MSERPDQRHDRLGLQERGELGPQFGAAGRGVDRLAGHQHPDLDRGRRILRLPPAVPGVEHDGVRQAHQGRDLAAI